MSAPAPLNITGQIMCAEVKQMRMSPDGVHEELIPSELRHVDGTCAHRDPELFADLTMYMEAFGSYLGLLGEKGELYHVWGTGAQAPCGQEDERTGPDPVAMVEAIRAAVVPTYAGHVPQPMAPDAMARVVEVERGPHPEPEYVGEWVLSDSPGPWLGDLTPPAPALLLAELAREAGWEVSMRYARGTGIHASQGRPLALRHSIALRFTGHPMTDRGAVAVYETNVSKIAWSWSSRWVIGADIGYRGELTMAELETFLREPWVSASWFAAIVTAAGEAAARTKLRAKMKPCDPDCEVDHAHKAAPKAREAKHGA